MVGISNNGRVPKNVRIMTFAIMHPIYYEMDFTLGPSQRTPAPNMANVTKSNFLVITI